MSAKHHPNNEEVRSWANNNGFNLGDRGRIPADVIQAWDRRHPKRKYVETEARHGTLQGFLKDKCRCDRCVKRHATYMVEFYTPLAA